jgi:hypothetical protein
MLVRGRSDSCAALRLRWSNELGETVLVRVALTAAEAEVATVTDTR